MPGIKTVPSANQAAQTPPVNPVIDDCFFRGKPLRATHNLMIAFLE
jgi:hypothetical protein